MTRNTFSLFGGRQKGFTLVELTVVVMILMVLTTIVAANMTRVRAKARDSRRIKDLRAIADAIQIYYTENNIFPDCGTTGCLEGILEPNYMKEFPSPPSSFSVYSYDNVCDSVDTTDQYRLYTTLERDEYANTACNCQSLGADDYYCLCGGSCTSV